MSDFHSTQLRSSGSVGEHLNDHMPLHPTFPHELQDPPGIVKEEPCNGSMPSGDDRACGSKPEDVTQPGEVEGALGGSFTPARPLPSTNFSGTPSPSPPPRVRFAGRRPPSPPGEAPCLRSSSTHSALMTNEEIQSMAVADIGKFSRCASDPRSTGDTNKQRSLIVLAESLSGAKRRLCDAVAAELDNLAKELVTGIRMQKVTLPCEERCNPNPADPLHERTPYMNAGLHSHLASDTFAESQLSFGKDLGIKSISREDHQILGSLGLCSKTNGKPSADQPFPEDPQDTSKYLSSLARSMGFRGHTSDAVGEQTWELFSYWTCNPYTSQGPRVSFSHDYMMNDLEWAIDKRSKKNIGDQDFTYIESDNPCVRKVIISPFSMKKLVWDMLGMALIAYDVIAVPLQTLELEDIWFTIGMMWIAMFFWLADFFLNFVVGSIEHHSSKVEMRALQIAFKYLTSWFIVDLIIVLPDWIILFVGSDSGGATRPGKIVRSMRALRALRLLRLAKFRKMLHTLESRVVNEYLTCYFQLGKIMVIVAVITHVVACCWYAMSNMEEADRGWIAQYGYNGGVKGDDRAFTYLTSLHWALCLFQGTTEIYPGTKAERAFAVVVQFLGLIVVSYFISSITHFMTEIRVIHTTVIQRRSRLIRYLKDMHISTELSVRVKQFADKVARTQYTPEEQVEILRNLPEEMKRDMDLEIKGPALGVHPLLNNLVWSDRPLALKFVEHMSQVSMHYSEVLFRRGEESSRMYVAMRGTLIYDKDAHALDACCHTVGAREWLCEMALWTHWEHRGMLTARSHCEVFGIVRERLAEITAHLNEESAQLVYTHARVFISWVNDLVSKTVDDLTHMPNTTFKKNRYGRATKLVGGWRSSGWRPTQWRPTHKSVRMPARPSGGGTGWKFWNWRNSRFSLSK